MSHPTDEPNSLMNNPKIEINKSQTNPDLQQDQSSSPFPPPYPLGIKSATNSDLQQDIMTLFPTYSSFSTITEDILPPPYPKATPIDGTFYGTYLSPTYESYPLHNNPTKETHQFETNPEH